MGNLFKYKIYGQTISTDLAFSHATKTTSSKIDLAFKISHKIKKIVLTDWTFFHRIKDPESNQAILSFYQLKKDFLLRFHRCGDFLIKSNGKKIYFIPFKNKLSNPHLEALFLHQVLPVVTSLKSIHFLHASGVKKNGRALFFLGNKGHGKSTLAAFLTQNGYTLLSDDAVPILFIKNQIKVLPALPEVRLFPKTGKTLFGKNKTKKAPPTFNKKRIRRSSPQKAFPLKKAVFIELVEPKKHTKKIKLEKASVSSSFVSLCENSFRLNFKDPEKAIKEFDLFSQLIENFSFFRLQYPRSFKNLTSVKREIENLF